MEQTKLGLPEPGDADVQIGTHRNGIGLWLELAEYELNKWALKATNHSGQKGGNNYVYYALSKQEIEEIHKWAAIALERGCK